MDARLKTNNDNKRQSLPKHFFLCIISLSSSGCDKRFYVAWIAKSAQHKRSLASHIQSELLGGLNFYVFCLS